MKVTLQTFGYKNGVPYNVDMVFDVRFLRNPYFVPSLQSLTGEEKEVQTYVLETSEAQSFLQHLQGLFSFLLPLFEREQRSYLTIAIGCTGGRHRSVVMAIQLGKMLKKLGYQAMLRHREIVSTSTETEKV